ncbi:MAG: hypothetical protein JXR83_14485, partial [Deltaproteobacteria bacterium]|nr:hypothetical protein [Deltaproteobacteria bacterium]
ARVLRLGARLAHCLQRIDPARGSALLLHLLDQVPPQRGAAERPTVFWRLAQCLRQAGQPQQAAAAIEHGLGCQALDQHPELRAVLNAEKALLLAASDGHQGAIFLLTEALDILGRTAVPAGGDLAQRYDLIGELYCHLARAHYGTHRVDRAQRAIDRAREVARYGKQIQGDVRALLCAAETSDDADLISVCLSKAVATADALADPMLQAEASLACGRDLLGRDRRAAQAILAKALRTATLSGRRDLAEAARLASEVKPS